MVIHAPSTCSLRQSGYYIQHPPALNFKELCTWPHNIFKSYTCFLEFPGTCSLQRRGSAFFIANFFSIICMKVNTQSQDINQANSSTPCRDIYSCYEFPFRQHPSTEQFSCCREYNTGQIRRICGSILGRGKRFFPYLERRTSCGATQLTIHCVTEIKLSGCEANLSYASSVKIKNKWNCNAIPPYAQRARGNFTFPHAVKAIESCPYTREVGVQLHLFLTSVLDVGVHTAPYKMGTGSLSRGQSGRGVALTTHLHLTLRLKKEQSYSSTCRKPSWRVLGRTVSFYQMQVSGQSHAPAAFTRRRGKVTHMGLGGLQRLSGGLTQRHLSKHAVTELYDNSAGLKHGHFFRSANFTIFFYFPVK